MKARESGMPDAEMWDSFFDPEVVLTELGLMRNVQDAVDFGCGYGTFSIPAARRIQGMLYGFDIEPGMIVECERRARREKIRNTKFCLRDFIDKGSGLEPTSVDFVMLFNILHVEHPLKLLQEAWRILKPGGLVAVIHWNHDPTTPRGPSMAIRPRPSDCLRWVEDAGFVLRRGLVNLPPYHYGLTGQRR